MLTVSERDGVQLVLSERQHDTRCLSICLAPRFKCDYVGKLAVTLTQRKMSNYELHEAMTKCTL